MLVGGGVTVEEAEEVNVLLWVDVGVGGGVTVEDGDIVQDNDLPDCVKVLVPVKVGGGVIVKVRLELSDVEAEKVAD